VEINRKKKKKKLLKRYRGGSVLEGGGDGLTPLYGSLAFSRLKAVGGV